MSFLTNLAGSILGRNTQPGTEQQVPMASSHSDYMRRLEEGGDVTLDMGAESSHQDEFGGGNSLGQGFVTLPSSTQDADVTWSVPGSYSTPRPSTSRSVSFVTPSTDVSSSGGNWQGPTAQGGNSRRSFNSNELLLNSFLRAQKPRLPFFDASDSDGWLVVVEKSLDNFGVTDPHTRYQLLLGTFTAKELKKLNPFMNLGRRGDYYKNLRE